MLNSSWLYIRFLTQFSASVRELHIAAAFFAFSGVKFAYSKAKHMHIADAIEVFVRLKEFLFDWRQEVLFDFAAQSEERLFAVGEIPLVELELEKGVFA